MKKKSFEQIHSADSRVFFKGTRFPQQSTSLTQSLQWSQLYLKHIFFYIQLYHVRNFILE